MRYLGVVLAFFILGCGDPEIPTASFPDSGDTEDANVCSSVDVQTDFLHCGRCQRSCSPADADRCFYGECLCGDRSPCGEGEDCRSGKCILKDPFGPSCEFDGECLPGHACIEGRCSFAFCVPEQCNGLDDDCDGIVDNVGAAPLSEFCLGDEPSPDIPLPPCQRGVRVCTAGEWSDCQDDVQPQPETGLNACDGVDNNCDGCVDSNVDPTTLMCVVRDNPPLDVVFGIDISGSMRNAIDSTKLAVDSFAGRLAGPDVRYALVTIPEVGEHLGRRFSFLLDLSPLPAFRAALAPVSADGGGTENTLDFLAAVGDGTIPISWAPDSVRIVILFTDEAGQTDTELTEEIVCDSFTRGELYAVFTDLEEEPIYSSLADECAYAMHPLWQGSQGSRMPCPCSSDEVCLDEECINPRVAQMIDNLLNLIENPCGS